MFKKIFITTTLIALAFTSLSWAQIDKIALYYENVGWTDVATATIAAEYIMANVMSANSMEAYNDADMATFAAENTDDGDLDIMIIFGYFPVSLYTPGNSQADGSVGELFLEGGDMILNTADYIFYVTEGGGANGDTGLKNMTDSNFDCWTADPNVPTEEGEQYIPSYEGAGAPRSFKISQIDADPDWELLVKFGSDGADQADPAIIRNVSYDGLVGIFYQISDNALPRGEVATEMIDNYIAVEIATAVDTHGKLPLTWGEIKTR